MSRRWVFVFCTLVGAAPSAAPSAAPAAPRAVALAALPRHRTALHVIVTRFQIGQGPLRHLGESRFRLLETLTLPALRLAAEHQFNFSWVLLVPPDLDAGVASLVAGALRGTALEARTFVVSAPRGAADYLELLYRGPLGTLDYVRKQTPLAKLAKKPDVLMYTRLDSDDAIGLEGMERLRGFAAGVSSDAHASAMCWADGAAMLWWPQRCAAGRGCLRLPRLRNATAVDKSKDECATAGLTVAWGAKGHLLSKEPRGAYGAGVHRDVSVDSVKYEGSPEILRGRAITSNSAQGVHDPNRTAAFDDFTPAELAGAERTNEVVQKQFGVTPDALDRCRLRMVALQGETALEQLASMCQPGFSCGNRAIRVVGEWALDSGNGSVDQERKKLVAQLVTDARNRSAVWQKTFDKKARSRLDPKEQARAFESMWTG
ncbi:hypothetical protein M885DRAFT_513445 [Pelagophyceae sp. CCMP2097]|nr:hypothetical protein M885DRAFT_513445 [Pelagophyceae sp. CCMP2097]